MLGDNRMDGKRQSCGGVLLLVSLQPPLNGSLSMDKFVHLCSGCTTVFFDAGEGR